MCKKEHGFLTLHFLYFVYNNRMLEDVKLYLEKKFYFKNIVVQKIDNSNWGALLPYNSIISDNIANNNFYFKVNENENLFFYYYPLFEIGVLFEVKGAFDLKRRYFSVKYVLYHFLYPILKKDLASERKKVEILSKKIVDMEQLYLKSKKEMEELLKTKEKHLVKIEELSKKLLLKTEENISLKSLLEEKDNTLNLIINGKKKLMKIYDTLKDPIMTIHNEFSIESINNAAANAFSDVTPIELIKSKKKCYEVIGKEYPCDYCFLDIIYKEKKGFSKTIMLERNGEEKYYILEMEPIFDSNGEIDVVIEYYQDISDSMFLLHEKEQLNSELKAVIDEKERMQLTVDWTNVEKMKELLAIVSSQKTAIRYLEAKVKRLNILIDNMKKRDYHLKKEKSMLYEIKRLINVLKAMLDTNKFVLDDTKRRSFEDAISLIKDYSVYMQQDYAALEEENENLRKTLEEYEKLLDNKKGGN